MALGARLRHAREGRGWSQEELSRRSGVRRALLSELETGKKSNPSANVLLALARVLHVSVDYLLATRYDL
jgi:transcriptional regulator with XRE-family HTH domain